MIKSVIFITFSVLIVVRFVVAREISEADAEENISLDSKLKSADDSNISIQNSTVLDLSTELKEENSPEDIKYERSANDSLAKDESEKMASDEEPIKRSGNDEVAKTLIAIIDIESSTQTTEERDRHAISKNSDENSTEKEDDEESIENGGHRHRNGPDDREDVKHILFALEPLEVDSMQISGVSSASNEDSGKTGTSRHGRPDIILGSRRVLKQKIVTAQALDALSKIGSSRSFPSDIVPTHTNSFNAPMHHPLPHDLSGPGGRNSPPSHDPGMYYREFMPISNSKERRARNYSLDSDANSYPYIQLASNAARSMPSLQFRSLFDHNYSPVLNPIYGGGRYKRNIAAAVKPVRYKAQSTTSYYL